MLFTRLTWLEAVVKTASLFAYTLEHVDEGLFAAFCGARVWLAGRVMTVRGRAFVIGVIECLRKSDRLEQPMISELVVIYIALMFQVVYWT